MKASLMDLSLFDVWLTENKQLKESTHYQTVMGVRRFLARNPDIDSIEDYNKYLIDYGIKKVGYPYCTMMKMFIEYKFGDTQKAAELKKALIKLKMTSEIKRERKYLSEDKLFDVINNIQKEKHRIIAIVQALTGVRAGDIMMLKRGSIFVEDYEHSPVLRINIIGKGGKRNVIYIHDKVAHELILDYVTVNDTGNEYYFLENTTYQRKKSRTIFLFYRMNYLWYHADLKQAMEVSGVDRKDFATHDFRRCFARRVWEKYKDIHVLQSILNHSDPKTSLRYLSQSGLKNIDYHKEMQS